MNRHAPVSKSELSYIRGFIEKAAYDCVHQPEGLLKNRYVTPTYSIRPGSDDDSEVADRSSVGHYLQMYDWDACFFSQSAHNLGIEGLSREIIDGFLNLQSEDGYVPRTISPNQTWDQGDQCKPFLCQTLWKEIIRTGTINSGDIKETVKKLANYLSFFHTNRQHESGMYHWRNVLESGVDNNLALLPPNEAEQSEKHEAFSYPDGELIAVDINTYLVVEFEAISKLAKFCGLSEISDEYRLRASKLKTQIEERLWCEESGMYFNFDPNKNQLSKIRAWTGLTPAIFGIGDPDRTKRVIQENILNQEQFFGERGITSLARSEALYNNAKRGLYGRALVCNWQGPVWTLPNALIVRALLRENYHDEAKQISGRVLRNMLNDIAERKTIHESYDGETGEPVWAPQFMSWNILALELIELLEQAEETEQVFVVDSINTAAKVW